jgi:hypothetical protein
LVAYRILIRNIDPKKCSGIGIGAPYLTRQCQFSQLLAISTCDCNQPTFTCWWRINNFEWMGKLENILYVKIVFACESMEKMTWFLCVCVCRCIFFLAKFHKILDLKNIKVAYILFHEGDASSPGNYKALDLHLWLCTHLQLHALVIPQGGCLPQWQIYSLCICRAPPYTKILKGEIFWKTKICMSMPAPPFGRH